MDLLITLLNIGIFQGLVIGGIIFRSPIFRSKANNYLAFALIALSISLLNFVLDDTGMYRTFPPLLFFDVIDSALLFPTLILFYVVYRVEPPLKQQKRKFLFFLPYIFTLLYSIIETVVEPGEYDLILVILELVQILVIFTFIPYLLVLTRTIIGQSVDQAERKWLIHLWSLTLSIFGSWMLAVLISMPSGIDIQPIMKVLTVIATFLIHWVSYNGVFKFKISQDQKEIQEIIQRRKSSSTLTEQPAQSEATELTEDKKPDTITKDNAYFQKLETLCFDDQIYRDSTLDREKVAELLGISTGYVSQLINTITGDNLSSYINQHRVEAVKQHILDPEFKDYSLLAIGLECGFSSKTTFHNSFKKFTGMTPNAFKKQQQ